MEQMQLTANILFAGIGCQERGFENSGVISLNVLAVSEIDDKSSISYAAIHKGLTPEMVENYKQYPSLEEMEQELTQKNIGFRLKSKKPFNWTKKKKGHEYEVRKNWLANHLIHNVGDISRVEALPEADLWTVSFPCQNISCAGKMEGLKDGSGTSSSLLWESIRLLKKSLDDGTPPKFLLFENVKQLVSKKFMPDFQNLMEALSSLRYRTYWKVLNAHDCGIPQNRERVFIVSIREDIWTGVFNFPKPLKLISTVDSILESGERIDIPINEKRAAAVIEMLEKNNIQQNNGYVNGIDGNKIYAEKATVNTGKKMEHAKYKVSKLTPEMCFQLMGMDKEDAQRCRAVGITDRMLCRQAGNGIVVNCIQLIAEHLYKYLNPSFVCTDEKKII